MITHHPSPITRRALYALVLLTVWLGASSKTFADGVDSVRFDTANWIFAPAVAADGQILGFLSWTEEQVVGNNISLLWYELDSQGNWNTWGWKHSDIGAAAAWLRTDLSEPHLFGFDHEIPDFIWAADPGSIDAPGVISNGLFVADPLSPVIGTVSDPSGFLEALAMIGYEAAPTASSMQVSWTSSASSGNVQIGPHPVSADCLRGMTPVEMMLGDLYARAESLLSTGEDLTTGRSCAWPCTCITTVVNTPTGPWASGAYPNGPNNSFDCRYTAPATQTVTKTGDTWLLCFNCASTTTHSGFLHDSCCYPGVTPCPTTPQSPIFSRVRLPNYP